MNPTQWIAIALAVVSFGGGWAVNGWRLNGPLAELRTEKAERLKADERAALTNMNNKERTDEEYAAARKRAHSAIVRAEPTAPILSARAPAPSGDSPASGCVSRRDIDDVLANFADDHAAGLTLVIAEVSQRSARRAEGEAAEFEGLAAAYRACRAFALGEQ